jgi:uncharacterized protein affecting Mg2+/Co2+ transport
MTKKIFKCSAICFAILFQAPLFAQTVTVSTLAGSGNPGSANGTGTAANFYFPTAVASDASGNVYVADHFAHKIRKITSAGIVSTLAGSITPGNIDGLGTSAKFNYPSGVAVDALGNVYVADNNNHTIRKITPAGLVSTFAGSGTAGSVDGIGTAASFYYPTKLALDNLGNVYVADLRNHKIRKITPAGVVSTLAGSGTIGDTDATGAGASFNYPTGVALDTDGNVYVSDGSNHKIRKITSSGEVSTFAGSGTIGASDGIGTAASFYGPNGIAIDASGNLYVADRDNYKIRKITPAGLVSTLAGTGLSGSDDGIDVVASFNNPLGVGTDASGNVYVADFGNHKIRKISTSTVTKLTDNQTASDIRVEIFPNPCNGSTSIYAEDLSAFVHLCIYSSTGILLYENMQISSNTKVELPRLDIGLYLLKIKGSQGEVIRKIVRY